MLKVALPIARKSTLVAYNSSTIIIMFEVREFLLIFLEIGLNLVPV